MSFESKVVIVTGSSSGIGAATAISFAKEGADVVVTGRNEEKLRKVETQCASFGRSPLVIKADVTNNNDVKKIIEETIKRFGKLDILVNNAGILRNGTLENGDALKVYDEVMETNVRAVVNLTNLAAPYLIASKGNIVNVSSVGGRQIRDGDYTAYSMSKAALEHFTRGAAIELSKHGVRVNSMSPGPVKTDLFINAGINLPYEEIGFKTLLNRWGDPEEIADIILFLASDKAKGVTGSNYTSDNGYLLLKY
ncbi:3-oxoacyl-[acyl-carrier-protein] reductase FabG-like [Zerene cesonia]|uniref:3-oxoacyl-[acyl-carrier-protein] reductase FabG-like n=1 Tax=Zerene cesonia TaxID=33412 RepID=UPI0018E58F94|nr:3-oxoacyl-[acyl-carrier-protein] reductase FabG-like [Zerene cesonia]